jgi:hypothetical protein
LWEPQHHRGGKAFIATEALKKAAARGNQQAKDAVAKYEQANRQAD